MGYEKSEAYVCDWCRSRAEPVPEYSGYGRTIPDTWSHVEGGTLLCGVCLTERSKAITEVRTRRSAR